MKKCIQEIIARGEDVYMMVVYCKDGGIHLLPCSSKEKCYINLLKMRNDPKCFERMEATTIVKRSAASFGDGKIFGTPKSLDVMALTDKQFENALEKYGLTAGEDSEIDF